MRADASHRSEQTNQLLFGDVADIIEVSGDFVFVKYVYDDYEGWCQRSQLAEISVDEIANAGTHLAANYINEININGTIMRIPLGCQVGHILKPKTFEHFTVEYHGKSIKPGEHLSDRNLMRQVAMEYVNTSYQWGGRSVFGVDCSGFCQMVFRFAGIPLLRDAYQQAIQGTLVGFLQEVQFGDLAFFDNAEERIVHVGILLDQNTIIHASGKVRIDTIDHHGIVNSNSGVRTHKLRVIKRIL